MSEPEITVGFINGKEFPNVLDDLETDVPGRKDYPTHINEKLSKVLVMRVGERAVAMSRLRLEGPQPGVVADVLQAHWPDEPTVMVDNTYTHPEFRNRNIATAMMIILENYMMLRQDKPQRLALSVRAHQQPAIRVYEKSKYRKLKLGDQETFTLTVPVGDGKGGWNGEQVPSYIMAKDLSPQTKKH
ncbi:GNAT family N-acetyltransferase [Candidatus Saccharibacteria bacterium]|nr:GNAT family N-acetyltransferase [Candidatus Saccharibacteria bacterium]